MPRLQISEVVPVIGIHVIDDMLCVNELSSKEKQHTERKIPHNVHECHLRI